MAKIVQLHGMSTASAALYVGPAREIIVDTGAYRLRVQDGVTPGGYATLMAPLNLSDLPSAAAARVNLALGSAAQNNTGDFVLSSILGAGVATLLGGVPSGTGGLVGKTAASVTGLVTDTLTASVQVAAPIFFSTNGITGSIGSGATTTIYTLPGGAPSGVYLVTANIQQADPTTYGMCGLIMTDNGRTNITMLKAPSLGTMSVDSFPTAMNVKLTNGAPGPVNFTWSIIRIQ